MVKSNNNNRNKNDVKKKSNSINDLCNALNNKHIKHNDNAIIYCRVSTQNQTLGTSLETQKDLATIYCNENNYKIIDVVNEVCSAKLMVNQKKLIDIVSSNNDFHLIIYDPSRISRNISDFAQLLQTCETKKITIHFITDNLVTNNNSDIKVVLSSIYDSEIEIKTLSKRVKASIEQRKRKNTYLSSIPKYGYLHEKQINGDKVVKFVKKNEKEQKIINLINKMYLGSQIKDIQELLLSLTGEHHEIFNCKNQDEKITFIEYGNMCFIDIANFLNSIELLRRNTPWTGNSISDIINERNRIDIPKNIVIDL